MNINEFENIEKVANIIPDDNRDGSLEVEFVAEEVIKDKKVTYAKVVDGDIKHIFESGNIRALSRYYKNHDSIQEKGDKATETNFAKYLLAKLDIEKGKRVEIYKLEGTKKECLNKYYEKENRYPDENFQANNEKFPEFISQAYDKFLKEKK